MITTFFLALVASFWGSVPPGPSNLAVMHEVLNKNTRAGLWLGLGACIPELPYSFFALMAAQYIATFQSAKLFFEISTVVLLSVMGIFSVFIQSRKKVDLKSNSKVESFKIHPFWKGAIIGSLNPMIFAFWLVTVEVASETGWLAMNSFSENVSFVLGAAIGALFLLIMVALFTRKIKQKLTSTLTSYLNKALGISYFLLALIQIVKIYSPH